MRDSFPLDWQSVFTNNFTYEDFSQLTTSVEKSYETTTVFPPSSDIFTAFTLCSFENTRVVILGQDPYHGPGQAQGLAFSVPDTVPIPPSLKNIYKEIASDTGGTIRASGNLTRLAVQGVLLLNTTLTVEMDKPGSHYHFGWERFTDAVITEISREKEQVVFLLWGAHAIKKRQLIDETKHLVLTAPHPSPLSAYRGFYGCKHFSKTNTYLQKHNLPTITW